MKQRSLAYVIFALFSRFCIPSASHAVELTPLEVKRAIVEFLRRMYAAR